MRVLAPDRPLRLISTPDQKIRLIADTGIDMLFIAQFDTAFARLSPEDFVSKYLIQGLKARSVCVGGNFNFGYRGSGTIATLRKFHQEFEIIEVPPVRVRGVLASSSSIRRLVADGAVSRACRLLGRWVEIEGRVVSGAGRGRKMEVPTVNLESENEMIPQMGVYVTRISLDNGPFMNAVTNIGIRPTFNETALTIETFVLNAAVRAGARKGRLAFLYRLRDEIKFESAEALRQQIAVDVRRAEKFFRMIHG
jgi:riboflavin kinase / FMN adenylyltransferase